MSAPSHPRRFLLAIFATVYACGPGEPLAEVTESSVLARERDVLTATLARLDANGADPFAQGDVLVSIREELIAELLEGVLPLTETVGQFRITADRAVVDFRGGLALVELEGRCERAEDDDTYADISIVGTLEVTGVGGHAADMRMRFDPLGFRTREVEVGGVAVPAERVVDRLSRGRLDEFADRLGELEIPVHLEEALELPAVQTDDVTIPAAELELHADLLDVIVSDRRMWLSLSLDLDATPHDHPEGTQ